MNWRPDWYDDGWSKQEDWYGPLSATLQIPEPLNGFQQGEIVVSAGFDRMAFAFLTGEYGGAPGSFGTVTWGGQTVEKLSELLIQEPGTGGNTFYVGVLREAAISQMTSVPIATTGFPAEVIITGSWQKVEQTIPIPSQCEGSEGFDADTITCSGPITIQENQPVLSFGMSSSSGAALSSTNPGFISSYSLNFSSMRHDIVVRGPGTPDTITPFMTWTTLSGERGIYSCVLQGKQTTQPLEVIVLDNPDSVELGAGWEDVT